MTRVKTGRTTLLAMNTTRWAGAAAAIRSALSAGADLLLPVACVACDRLVPPLDRGVVCGCCWLRARELPHPQCERCGHPMGAHICSWCPNLPPFVRAARSFCWIGVGTGAAVVHALKYDGWTATADAMASRMERLSWPRDVTEGRTAVVAVPLSAARLRERGFNQSQHLADRLARVWRIPLWTDVLLRVRATRSQTELTPAERLGNVAGAFSVPHSAAPVVRGAHVILVDDVITTGATLGACAKALFASGALTISYMTFGRAPDSGDRIFTGERDYNGNQGWHQRIWPDRTTGPSRREGGPG